MHIYVIKFKSYAYTMFFLFLILKHNYKNSLVDPIVSMYLYGKVKHFKGS